MTLKANMAGKGAGTASAPGPWSACWPRRAITAFLIIAPGRALGNWLAALIVAVVLAAVAVALAQGRKPHPSGPSRPSPSRPSRQ